MRADTKYPIVLVHGMGFRDRKHICYWGRIPKVLRRHGAAVYFGEQDSNGSIETNARQLAKRIDEILAKTHAPKVNVLAHSKGGLEMRYLISSMGYGDRIASLTTLATPHHGSKTLDRLAWLPDGLLRFGCKVADLWFRLLGDRQPDTYRAIQLFLTKNAAAFNRANPDDPRVYYQSYGFVMPRAAADLTMWFPWTIVHAFEGENDGLLAPRAVKWTNFRGIYTGQARRGVSHMDEIDGRRMRVRLHGEYDFDDVPLFYLHIAAELKRMGF